MGWDSLIRCLIRWDMHTGIELDPSNRGEYPSNRGYCPKPEQYVYFLVYFTTEIRRPKLRYRPDEGFMM